MMQEFVLKQLFSDVDKRKYTRKEAAKVLEKYPDRIPVIVNKSSSACDKTPDLDKEKYLVSYKISTLKEINQ